LVGRVVGRTALPDRIARDAYIVRAFSDKNKGRHKAPRCFRRSERASLKRCLEEINQHYRQAIRIYHPDKVAEMAPEIIALAEQRTKELNAAFSQAKRVRGGAVK
jgi:hypothetical protein